MASSQGMQTIGDLRDFLQEVEQYVEPVLLELSKIEGDHPASSVEDQVTKVILVCKKLSVEVWNDYYLQADECKEAQSLIP
ncbi:hypothetical protein [Streptomyces sp. NPDC004830]